MIKAGWGGLTNNIMASAKERQPLPLQPSSEAATGRDGLTSIPPCFIQAECPPDHRAVYKVSLGTVAHIQWWPGSVLLFPLGKLLGVVFPDSLIATVPHWGKGPNQGPEDRSLSPGPSTLHCSRT